MNLTRRKLLTGLIAAPIVVRAGLLMPVKALDDVRMIGLNLGPVKCTERYVYGGTDLRGIYAFLRPGLNELFGQHFDPSQMSRMFT